MGLRTIVSFRMVSLVLIFVVLKTEAGVNPPNCGKRHLNRQPRIVNGQQANLGEFPWTVAVGWKSTRDHQTGTIVSDRWILMAAHSVASPTWTSPPESMNITAGTVDLTQPGGRQYFISRVVPHPKYVQGSNTNRNYDVTLIQTTETIEFNSNVNAICLPNGNENYSGRNAEISGFGLNEWNNGDTLRKLPCSIYYEKDAQQFSCRSGKNSGLAGGDSGSPLLVRENSNIWTQVGVSTTGYKGTPTSDGFAYGPITVRSDILTWIKGVVG